MGQRVNSYFVKFKRYRIITLVIVHYITEHRGRHTDPHPKTFENLLSLRPFLRRVYKQNRISRHSVFLRYYSTIDMEMNYQLLVLVFIRQKAACKSSSNRSEVGTLELGSYMFLVRQKMFMRCESPIYQMRTRRR